ncbi:MAG: glycogen synthase [Tissierellia bacterium]|nr:glycogen synthase [Tissierellia bacterium]
MKVLFVTSELHPLVKTGGLADVSAILPRKLREAGAEVTVILPNYRQIPGEYREKFRYIAYDFVDMGPHREYVGVLEYVDRGLRILLVDNESLFFRDSLYGQGDDGRRFAYFCKAAVQLMGTLDLWPQVVHVNDWFTGLIPLYIQDFAKGDPRYRDIATLLTIHNVNYNGAFDFDTFAYTGLSGSYYHEEGVKYYGGMSFLKAGIVYADGISTVSRTYARELTYDFYGREMAGLLRKYRHKLTGIQNGIDLGEYDPATDPLLPVHYDIHSLEKKRQNKHELQRRLSLPVGDGPLFVMVSRLVDIKGVDLLLGILDEMLRRELQLVILGTGDPRIEDALRRHHAPDKYRPLIQFNESLSHLLYGAGDFFLMPSITEPSGLSQMIAMHYGNVPIVRNTGGLGDTVGPREGRERGILFENINSHELLAAVDRALGLYGTAQHRELMVTGMTEDFSWEEPTREYLELYASLLRKRGLKP